MPGARRRGRLAAPQRWRGKGRGLAAPWAKALPAPASAQAQGWRLGGSGPAPLEDRRTCPTQAHLAKQVANADSGTCGPHTGRRPLHLVLAFCRAALSHSSRPRASLWGPSNAQNSPQLSRQPPGPHGAGRAGLQGPGLCLARQQSGHRRHGMPARGPSPDGGQVAVVVDNVEVRDGAVALLLPGLVLELLQGDPLGEGVNAQHFGWLQQRRGEERGMAESSARPPLGRGPALLSHSVLGIPAHPSLQGPARQPDPHFKRGTAKARTGRRRGAGEETSGPCGATSNRAWSRAAGAPAEGEAGPGAPPDGARDTPRLPAPSETQLRPARARALGSGRAGGERALLGAPGTCSPPCRCSRSGPAPLSAPPSASAAPSWSPLGPSRSSERGGRADALRRGRRGAVNRHGLQPPRSSKQRGGNRHLASTTARLGGGESHHFLPLPERPLPPSLASG